MVATSSDALSLAHAVLNGVLSRAKLLSRTLLVANCAIFLNACDSSALASASGAGMSNAAREAGVLSVVIDIKQNGGTILLSTELTNSSDQEVLFLPWGTPFEGAITADFLRVKEVGNSAVLAYTGIMVKRRPSSAEDYMTVKSGSSVKKIVDISKSYDFCANAEYEITYSQTLLSPDARPYIVQSNVATLKVANQLKACQ